MSIACAALAAELPRTRAPADALVYIIAPADGATVQSPFQVTFGLRGMGVAPAGVAVADTGHHHLLIDTDPPPPDRPIPADANHLHFGKGQTEAVVSLPPGKHRLQLLLADHLHVPHEPPLMSKPITVTVE